MNKINKLYNYLIKNSCTKEAEYLFKLAHNQTAEEYLQEYPFIYTAFQKDTKSAPAWINLIHQIQIKGIKSKEELKKENIQTFQDLIDIKNPPENKEDRYFGNIQDPELTESLKNIIKNSMPKEVFNYLYNQTQHSLVERIEIYQNKIDRINKAKTQFPDFNHDITQYETLDDFIYALDNLFYDSNEEKTLRKFKRYYDYIWEGIVHEDAPPGTYDTYKDVERGGAKANSKIVGELPNHIVVLSNSKEAAQYWEKGAVIIRENNPPQFQTCTSRINTPEDFNNTNLYGNYEEYDMYQIIRKNAISNGEPKFYNESPNTPNHLITMCVNLHNSNPIWGDQYTVNSSDKPIYIKEFKKEIGEDNYNKFLEIISMITPKNYLSKLPQQIQDLYDQKQYADDERSIQIQNEINELENEIINKAKEFPKSFLNYRRVHEFDSNDIKDVLMNLKAKDFLFSETFMKEEGQYVEYYGHQSEYKRTRIMDSLKEEHIQELLLHFLPQDPNRPIGALTSEERYLIFQNVPELLNAYIDLFHDQIKETLYKEEEEEDPSEEDSEISYEEESSEEEIYNPSKIQQSTLNNLSERLQNLFKLGFEQKKRKRPQTSEQVLNILKEKTQELGPRTFFENQWYKAESYKDITKNKINKLQYKLDNPKSNKQLKKNIYAVFKEIIQEIETSPSSWKTELNQDVKNFFIDFIKKYQDDKELMISLFIKFMKDTHKRSFKEMYQYIIKFDLPDSFLNNIYTNHFSEKEIQYIEDKTRRHD
jgi:hypothetical protein